MHPDGQELRNRLTDKTDKLVRIPSPTDRKTRLDKMISQRQLAREQRVEQLVQEFPRFSPTLISAAVSGADYAASFIQQFQQTASDILLKDYQTDVEINPKTEQVTLETRNHGLLDRSHYPNPRLALEDLRSNKVFYSALAIMAAGGELVDLKLFLFSGQLSVNSEVISAISGVALAVIAGYSLRQRARTNYRLEVLGEVISQQSEQETTQESS